MKDLEKMLQMGQYDEIIKLTKNSHNVDEIFICIIAMTFIGKIRDAQNCIDKNKSLLLSQPARLIEVHINMYMYIGDFITARDILNEYAEMQYISQEVEETLKEMQKLIRKAEKSFDNNKKFKSIEEIDEMLKSEDSIIVQSALTQSLQYDIKPLLPSFLKLLMNKKIDGATRRLALMTLQNKEYDKPVKFFYEETDEIVEVIPTKLGIAIDPRGNKKFNERVEALRNVTLADIFKKNYEIFTFFQYPLPFTISDDDLYYAVLLSAYEAIGLDKEQTVDEILDQKLDLNAILKLKNKLQDYLKTFSA